MAGAVGLVITLAGVAYATSGFGTMGSNTAAERSKCVEPDRINVSNFATMSDVGYQGPPVHFPMRNSESFTLLGGGEITPKE